MRTSKYSSQLHVLSKRPLFTAAEAGTIGIPARMLAYFFKQGLIERLSRGVYRVKGVELDVDFEWEDLALTAISIPQGVICLISY